MGLCLAVGDITPFIRTGVYAGMLPDTLLAFKEIIFDLSLKLKKLRGAGADFCPPGS